MAKRKTPTTPSASSISTTTATAAPKAAQVVAKKGNDAAGPAAPQKTQPVVTSDQIAKRAYDIWVAKGRPVGLDLQNWQQAERELGVTPRK